MVKLNIKVHGKVDVDIQFETDDSLVSIIAEERPMIEKLFTLLAQAENDKAIRLCQILQAEHMQKMQEEARQRQRQSHGQKKYRAPTTVKRPSRGYDEDGMN